MLASSPPRALPDLAFRTLDSPLGTLLIARSERGLLRIALAQEDQERVLAELAMQVGGQLRRHLRALDGPSRELERYFSGTLRRFACDIDLRLAKGFRRLVLERLKAVQYGTTTSYSALAVACENPRAVRAVASACAQNPLPIVIPCHRVLRANGSLGGYAGGLQAKRWLLSLEREQPRSAISRS
jgi:methylated-DNA-[protein]-cysteine S-methyltransferase